MVGPIIQLRRASTVPMPNTEGLKVPLVTRVSVTLTGASGPVRKATKTIAPPRASTAAATAMRRDKKGLRFMTDLSRVQARPQQGKQEPSITQPAPGRVDQTQERKRFKTKDKLTGSDSRGILKMLMLGHFKHGQMQQIRDSSGNTVDGFPTLVL